MHPMVAHESSAGTAKRMWTDKPADAPKPMAVEQFVPFMSDYKFFEDMGVRVFDNGHSFTGVHFSIHSKYSAIPAYDDAMKARLRRGARRADPRHGAPQHGVLPEPHDQGRDPGDPRRQADRGRQDADRELDLPPERARRPSCCSARRCTTGSSTRRSRSSATTTCRPTAASRPACTRAATSGSACTATSTRPRLRAGEVTTDRHQRDLDAQPVPRLGRST